MHATEPLKFAYRCAHSEHEKIRVVMTYECLNLGILNKYTPTSIKVALGLCHWNTQYNALLEWLPNNGFQRAKHDSQSNLYWSKCIFLQSPLQSFQVTWYIDQKSRKGKLQWSDYVPMCVQGKIPSGRSLWQMGKQLHKGAIKPGPGFSRASVSRSPG